MTPASRGTKEYSSLTLAATFGSPGLRHRSSVTSSAVASDGAWAVSGSDTGELKIWDLVAKKPLRTLTGHVDAVTSVTISPNGKFVASGGLDNQIIVWDVSTGKAKEAWPAHEDFINALAFVDDDVLLSASTDKTIGVWKVSSKSQLTTLRGHEHDVVALAVAPDGKAAASASQDHVFLWDLKTFKRVKSFSGHRGRVFSVGFAPDGKSIATCGQDGTLRLWNVADGVQRWQVDVGEAWVFALAFSQDGKMIATGTSPTIKLWSTKEGKHLADLNGHTERVSSLNFFQKDQYLLSGSADTTIRIWNVASRQEIDTRTGHRSQVNAVALSRDGRLLASGGEDESILVWNTEANQLVKSLVGGHHSAISGLAFYPKADRLLSASYDGTILRWDIDTATSQPAGSHLRSVLSLALSQDGWLALSTSQEVERIKLWNAKSGDLLWTKEGHTSPVTSVAFNANRSLAVTGATGAYGADDVGKTLIVWDVTKGAERLTLDAHRKGVACVAMSPDGQRVLSGAMEDGHLSCGIWLRASEPVTLGGHKDGITGVDFV
ncbi:MAG: WD40 repeat domain-containing protein [Myxococcota bacterium]